jgi:hypothetical protein
MMVFDVIIIKQHKKQHNDSTDDILTELLNKII